MKKLIITKYVLLSVVATALSGCAVKSGTNTNTLTTGYAENVSRTAPSEINKPLSFKGSEDQSKLLVTHFNVDEIPEADAKGSYFANTKFNWIITLEANANVLFKKDSVNKYFSGNWKQQAQYPTLYVLPKNSTSWVLLNSSDYKNTEYQKIALVWKLHDTKNPEKVYTKEELSKLDALAKKNMQLLKTNKITYNYPADQAAETSQKLTRLITDNNKWALIILKADNRFDGRDIWDVMMSVGLEWGDKDLFHWNNKDFPFADSKYLSVWTHTDPGYFLPDDIQQGKTYTKDLVFGFSIPRSIAPKDIYEAMYNISLYAQERLGGTLTDAEGNTVNMDKQLKQIDTIVKNLEKEAIHNGTGDALFLFQ